MEWLKQMFNAHAVSFHRDIQSPDMFSTGVEQVFRLLAVEISALLSQIFCVNLFSVKGWWQLAFTIIKNYRKCFSLNAY